METLQVPGPIADLTALLLRKVYLEFDISKFIARIATIQVTPFRD